MTMLKFLLIRLNALTKVANTEENLDRMQKAIERVHTNQQVYLLRTDYLE
ncbi:hypothetical protein [Acinetobacter tandoii]|uniref:Uncharacterized protein n=1 Tax=Acinetobacter tandoii DSM 14970 = CIP 107469 TaxID=1120927 RepID=R9B6A3_9GAMM|nr:hypothetical protein [Acinetobacter tandoii]EOR09957.1 hypothetical protein I593_00884 [Acinetobacter tandoii DSM 14970 = CIP 107469]